MTEIANQRIELLPPPVKDRIKSTGTLTVEGAQYEYLVVDRSLPNAPPWFVGFHEPSGLFFINNELQAADQELVLRHEMFELGTLGGKGEGRCERALFYELAHCPTGDREDHLHLRLMMFKDLLKWINDPAQRDSYPAERRGEIERTHRRLALIQSSVE